MNWNAYTSRRNINAIEWLRSRGVKDRETFLKLLVELNIEPPGDDQIATMFPPAAVPNVVKGVDNGSASVSSEGSDKVATRSVDGEGDGTGQRTDGKRTSKVRD